MSLTNLHATAVVLGESSVLITGPSGAGKTTLALDLAREAHSYAAFVSDDQCLVEAIGGRLIVRRPASIAGLAEIPGFVPSPVPSTSAAIVDLVVDLISPVDVERFAELGSIKIEGIAIPLLRLPQRHAQQARLAVLACLGSFNQR